MKREEATVPVVDLFAGPGGLAEGFCAPRVQSETLNFRVALTVEVDRFAFETLRLRAFLRKFANGFPNEYYNYLNGITEGIPEWSSLFPKQWNEACQETLCLKIGTHHANTLIRDKIQAIRAIHGGRTVLLGGPPCQSYSLIGRVRNAANAGYEADKDKRQSLYREFVAVLRTLQPAVAVMENVKGILSAQYRGRPVFPQLMDSLRHAGGRHRYTLVALDPSAAGFTSNRGHDSRQFVVRSESFGVPQKRHRIFVVCIRNDLAEALPQNLFPRLVRANRVVNVHDVIGEMPRLRSKLSKSDNFATWKKCLYDALITVESHVPSLSRECRSKFNESLANTRNSIENGELPYRDVCGGVRIAKSCPANLRRWIQDPHIMKLPNNETRGHIKEDLSRYLFASSLAFATGRTPKSIDFPQVLSPRHANWNKGQFADRFRVQLRWSPATTITSHISKDGHYYIHPDPSQCRSLTVREVARIQTFPDNYFFQGPRTQQYIQVGNAVPPYLAYQIANQISPILEYYDRITSA